MSLKNDIAQAKINIQEVVDDLQSWKDKQLYRFGIHRNAIFWGFGIGALLGAAVIGTIARGMGCG